MLYFTIKEFLIPKLEPVVTVDSKFAISILKTIREETPEPETKESNQLQEKPKEEAKTIPIIKEKKESSPKIKSDLKRKPKPNSIIEEDEKAKALKAKKEKERKQLEIEKQTVTTEAIYRDVSLNNPSPKYPIISKKEGEEGEVILLVRISALGQASEVVLYKSSGYERLDNASIHAVKSWRFIAAKNKFGDAVESVVKIPFVFKVREEK